LSSRRSYGRLATMTLVLDGMPSSGGPRCLRGARGSPDLSGLASPAGWAPASPAAGTGAAASAPASLPLGPSARPCKLDAGPDSRSRLTPRPPRAARPPRPPRPRPRPRVEPRRRASPPLPVSPPLVAPSPCGSGLRASWMETLRSRMMSPLSSVMARSASVGVDRSTKA
jgi:hypothetical protein